MATGRSVAWYARLLGVQEVVSSNLTAPTICVAAEADSLPAGTTIGTYRLWRCAFLQLGPRKSTGRFLPRLCLDKVCDKAALKERPQS